MMISELILGFRESFEAAIIVSLLFSYLKSLGRKESVAALWAGVLAALGLSISFAFLLSFLGASLSEAELFEAFASLLAVVLISYVVLMFRNYSREALRKKAESALRTGTLGFLAFVSVLREGVELSLMLFSISALVMQTLSYVILGVILGVLSAVLLYRGFKKQSLSSVFKATNILLILIAGGLLSSAIHGFQEEGWLPLFSEQFPSILRVAFFSIYVAVMSYLVFRKR